jgi:hypothetical protein
MADKIRQYAIVDTQGNIVPNTVSDDGAKCWIMFLSIPMFYKYISSGIDAAIKDGYRRSLVEVSNEK